MIYACFKLFNTILSGSEELHVQDHFPFIRNDGPLSNNLASYKNTTPFSQSCFIELFIHELGMVIQNFLLYLLLELRKIYFSTTY